MLNLNISEFLQFLIFFENYASGNFIIDINDDGKEMREGNLVLFQYVLVWFFSIYLFTSIHLFRNVRIIIYFFMNKQSFEKLHLKELIVFNLFDFILHIYPSYRII